ncbi:MAG TPA: alpha/beta hydrolase [Thermoanaerobaculia bacterium]|nr:alpha/beta hydrolase [Thermoanaerobaculia bacterium]
MPPTAHLRLSDLRGTSRLAIEATLGVTSLVETMHHNIARVPGVLGAPTEKRTRGITGLVYRSIRGVTRLVGGGIDAALRLLPSPGDPAAGASSAEREAVLAALNGVLGDHLAASANPLAIPMRLRRDGEPTGKILLLAHGLCLNDRQWRRNGHDHGAALAADAGFTPVYLHYNSGFHISTNGRALAGLLEDLLRSWPVPVDELVILAHSMGGLVSRNACHHAQAAGHGWPRHLRKIVFLGTPHHGSPLERGGNWVDFLLGASPYTAALARLGKIRSAGITDLRHGNLLNESLERRDRFVRAPENSPPPAVPLPEGVQCYAVAASIATQPSVLKDRLLGDGLVPVSSALGQHADPGRTLPIPESQQWIGYGMNHFDLLERREVYERICGWVTDTP